MARPRFNGKRAPVTRESRNWRMAMALPHANQHMRRPIAHKPCALPLTTIRLPPLRKPTKNGTQSSSAWQKLYASRRDSLSSVVATSQLGSVHILTCGPKAQATRHAQQTHTPDGSGLCDSYRMRASSCQGGRRQLDPSTTVKRPRFRSRDLLIGERRLVVDRSSNWQYRSTRHIEDRRGRARHDFGEARRDFELLDIPAKSTANEAGRHAVFQ